MDDFHSVSYKTINGGQYSVIMYGNLEEIQTHCENLGFEYCGVVVLTEPFDAPSVSTH